MSTSSKLQLIEEEPLNWAEESAKVAEERQLETTEVTASYRKTVKEVPQVVAERKKWKKFGQSEDDGPGPHASTTFVSEEVPIQFARGKLRQEFAEERRNKKAEESGDASYCRFCKARGHWSKDCPNKEANQDVKKEASAPVSVTTTQMPVVSDRYVPPSARRGQVSEEVETACRISNLPTDMPDLEEDLRVMMGKVAFIVRLYMGRDKKTGELLGYANAIFKSRADADKIIEKFNGYKYQYMIMQVELKKQF